MKKRIIRVGFGWKEGGLQLATRKYLYFFYRIHLIRMISVILAVLGAIWLARYLTQREYVTVVWRTGELFVYHQASDQWIATSDSELDRPARLRAGDQPVRPLQTITEDTMLESLKTLTQQRSVIRFNPYETVILTNGSGVERKAVGSTQVEYTLTGVAYLTVNPAESGEEITYSVNGIHLGVKGCTIMYQDLILPAEITALAGECWITPEQKKFLHLDDGLPFTGEKAPLTDESVLVITDDLIYLEEQLEDREELRRSTFLPGFDLQGHYQAVGEARTSSGEYQLIRDGKTYQVREFQIPVMAGDRIVNTSFVPVLIELDSGDKIRLYPQAEISLPDPIAEEGKELPLLLLKARAIAQEIANETAVVYPVKGRVRIRVVPASQRKLSFRTVTAEIGIKGTEFEIDQSREATEALVVGGIVEMNSIDNPPAVAIGRGYMSRAEKGKPAVLPYPIPPERFKELLIDAFDKDQKPLLVAGNLVLDQLSIKPGQTIVFEWSKPIRSSNLVIDGISYSLKQTDHPNRAALDRSLLQGVSAGKYTVRIEALDLNQIWGEADGQLSVLPGKSLAFICTKPALRFTESELDAIREFQRDARIKVDGIVGPETRRKIRELLNCQ